MKLLKLILFALFFSCFNSLSNITIYRTFEEYKEESGAKYDDIHAMTHTGSVSFKLLRGKEKFKISCEDLWGFHYKDALFRIDKKNNQPVKLISDNKIMYYENGWAHINMLRYNSNSAKFSIGYFCYFSKSMDSEIIAIPRDDKPKVPEYIKDFLEKNPEFYELFDCFPAGYFYVLVMKCVNKYQGLDVSDELPKIYFSN